MIQRSSRSDIRHYTMSETPVGPISIVAKSDAVSGIYMQDHRHAPDPVSWGAAVAGDSVLNEAARQLREYFQGERRDFDLAVSATGTAFQTRVWLALREIPYGQTWTYGQLAAHIGQPGASRAVGLANGRNPISIVVPCHRVVGASGALTGYGGGVHNKQALLEIERGSGIMPLEAPPLG